MAVLAAFSAHADLVGNRVRVAWDWRPDDGAGELGPVPGVRLRGKDLDFAFEELDEGGALYDSAAFPPPPADDRRVAPAVTLPVTYDADEHRVETTVSTVALRDPRHTPTVARPDLVERPDAWVEVARLTTRRVVTADGRTVARRDEFLDVGGLDGLVSHVARCYRLEVDPDGPAARHHDDVAVPTRGCGHSMTLYHLLPTAWRRDDEPPAGRGPASDQIGAVPESRLDAGPLRRFVDLFGLGTDHLRSRADGLRTLHDVERVDPRHLGHLAHLVGWEMWADRVIAEQRHAIRYASRLYGLTGTVPGVQLWAKRLTGWDVELAEFAENVIWSNDPGGERSPTRSGSRSLDTGDPEVLARLKRPDDRADYTYDTRSSSDAWYSPHTIGIFPTLEPDEPRADVDQRRDRLLAATDRYLPGNLRVVVVLPDEPVTHALDMPIAASVTADEVHE